MNINELRNAPPQTKQFLDAQLLSIGISKGVNTQRGQRNVQELLVVDQQGVQEKIAYWYDTNKPDFAMPQQQINQWLRWVVKTKPNGQYLNISGYPETATTPPQQAPPQQQSYTPPPQTPSHLNAATQAIIDSHRPPATVATEAIHDHLAGSRPGDGGTVPPQTIPDSAPILQNTTQQDYQAKEREKILGMCFTNLLAGRLAAVCPTEMEKDLGVIAALWRLSAICIDGTGQVQEILPQQLPDPKY